MNTHVNLNFKSKKKRKKIFRSRDLNSVPASHESGALATRPLGSVSATSFVAYISPSSISQPSEKENQYSPRYDAATAVSKEKVLTKSRQRPNGLGHTRQKKSFSSHKNSMGKFKKNHSSKTEVFPDMAL